MTKRNQPRDSQGRFRSRQNVRRKQSVTHKPLAESTGGMSVQPAADLLTYQAVLELNVWCASAVARLAAALSSVDFRIVQTGTDEDATGGSADRVRELFQRVNEYQTRFDFFEASFTHLAIDGEVAIEKARDRFKDPRELHVLNPAFIEVEPDETGMRPARAFVWRFRGKEVRIPAEDMIWCKYHHPGNPYRGLSPMSAIRREVAGDIEAARYNMELIRKGMRPGGIISPKEGDLDDQSWDRLKKGLREQIGGSRNAGNLMALPFGFDFLRDTITPREMDFLGARKFTREAVASAWGVAPMMLNNFDSATYANSEQQLKAFWDYTGKPCLLKLFGALNEHLVHREIDPAISIVPDLVAIAAQIDSEKTRVDNTTKLLNGGVITINEARSEMGYGALPDGDKLLIQGALVPMSPDAIENPLAGDAGIESEEPGFDDEGESILAPLADDGPDDSSNGSTNGILAERHALLFGLNGHRNGTTKVKGPSPEEREAIQRLHAKGIVAARRRVRGATRSALIGFRRRVQSRLNKQNTIPQVSELIPDVRAEAQQMFKEVAPTVLDVMRDEGNKVLRRLGFESNRDLAARAWFPSLRASHLKADARVEPLFTLNNPVIRDFMQRHLFTHLYRVSQHALGQLEKLIEEARSTFAEGEGTSAFAMRIQQMPVFGAKRADVIAHTETIAAIGTASYEAFQAAGTPRKSWLTTGRGNVRESHRRAELETSKNPIPVDKPFILEEPERGRAECRFPGDPQAPGWAAIECYCSLVPEAAEGDQRSAAFARFYAKSCLEELRAVEAVHA